MAKLVILNQGMTGRAFEVNVERTTVGRLEDNTFQIADPSVSSHHAEIVLKGSDLLIRDIGSTNGTFINGEKITEAVLQPGQTLRFGQVELKIDDGKPVSAPAPVPAAAASAPAPAPAAAKKSQDGTMIVPRGVSLTDLEQSGVRPSGFDTNASFSKKTNKTNTYFIIGGIVVGVVILGLILFLIKQAGGSR
jgi:predicted component of type VI protein secretion system